MPGLCGVFIWMLPTGATIEDWTGRTGPHVLFRSNHVTRLPLRVFLSPGHRYLVYFNLYINLFIMCEKEREESNTRQKKNTIQYNKTKGGKVRVEVSTTEILNELQFGGHALGVMTMGKTYFWRMVTRRR